MHNQFIATVLVTIPLGSAAHAAIVRMDSEFGSNSVTRDVDNGLDYLDLTQTIGVSYNDMVSTHLAVGGQFEGWRYANRDEYDELLVSAGISRVGQYPVGDVDFFVGSFGTTGYINDDGWFAAGLLEDEVDDQIHSATGLGFFRNFENDQYEPIFAGGAALDHEASNEFGHYLVRAVPAPGSVSILAAAGIFTRRRRDRRD
ncbi:MAG: hypothetical protein ACSHX5_11870 [Phycisphaerales bacterium]